MAALLVLLEVLVPRLLPATAAVVALVAVEQPRVLLASREVLLALVEARLPRVVAREERAHPRAPMAP
jgi:hypothetical protein